MTLIHSRGKRKLDIRNGEGNRIFDEPGIA
jgi:hypothetical protein